MMESTHGEGGFDLETANEVLELIAEHIINDQDSTENYNWRLFGQNFGSIKVCTDRVHNFLDFVKKNLRESKHLGLTRQQMLVEYYLEKRDEQIDPRMNNKGVTKTGRKYHVTHTMMKTKTWRIHVTHTMMKHFDALMLVVRKNKLCLLSNALVIIITTIVD